LVSASIDPGLTPRQALRKTLLAQREEFMAGPLAAEAGVSLVRHLRAVLAELEPELLGLYWPHRREFNAAAALVAAANSPNVTHWRFALPFAQRAPVQLHYRAWQGEALDTVDDCGIPCSVGAEVLPDVVLVPCVGFTRAGHRLGYGGGYFDRWLASHPDVTSIGVAWSGSELDEQALRPQPHDLALTLVVTERGVV